MLTKKKNILVVSASIGDGHNQAAKAIMLEVKQRYPSARVKVTDFMAGANSYLNSLVKESYLRMINIFPDMYDFLYRWSQASHSTKVQNLMVRAMKRSMRKIVRYYRPDLLIFTHPFPCGAAAYLRRTGDMQIPIIGVITDFAVHRMWIYNEVDVYFVAGDELKTKLVSEGISREKIYVTGIPINPKFADMSSILNIQQGLSLKSEIPVVLIMGGGLGLGSVRQALASLNEVNEQLQIVVVAGTNEELRQSAIEDARKSRHIVRVLGYTQHIYELMAISSLLITKPGALTISEALAMQLPMLFYQPIPGQEEENALYVTAKGAGIWARTGKEITVRVSESVRNPEILNNLKDKAKELSRPRAAADIADIIVSYIKNDDNAVSQ